MIRLLGGWREWRVLALTVVLLCAGVRGHAQILPVRLIAEDTTSGETLLKAYLRPRFEALGVQVIQEQRRRAVELHFSVLSLTDGNYDVASVLAVCAGYGKTRTPRRRSAPPRCRKT